MKIVVLEGSPNKKGSTHILADCFRQGAEEAGHTVELLNVAHADIHPCTGCIHCGYEGPCVQKDDVGSIREKILGADMMVFATPLYYYGMGTVKLSNGVIMPMEGFGVFQIPEEACEQAVKDAISIGYRLIDTASSYQNEEAVGRAIQSCGIPREELFITTKAYIQQMGYEKTKGAFEESLNKLGLTYLDLYLVHMPFGDYYGSWRALEELYQEGKIRAIGVCNFLPDRLLDLCYNAKILPQINQIERHPHYQRSEELFLMKGLQVQPEAWAPFAEGLKGMFTEPALLEIAQKHGKTPAQVILRWNVQQGVIVIPKSVHKERMKENLDIWDFMLDSDDMEKIATLDKDCPSMLDTRKISEVKRVYDYLNNPVLTSL